MLNAVRQRPCMGGRLFGVAIVCAVVPSFAVAAEDGAGAMVVSLILPALAFALGALLLVRSRRR